MAQYSKEDIFKQSLELIEKHKLHRTVDLIAFLPCEKSVFYALIPAESEEMEAIKRAYHKNKVDIKVSLKAKWYKSDNPTLQLALYKLLADEEEHKRLQQNYTDITSGNERLNVPILNIDPFSDEGNDSDKEDSES
jgi:hypothetical protein